MRYTTRFKVVDHLLRPQDETHYVYLLSYDGQYWRVALDDYSQWASEIWGRIGLILEFPLVLVTNGPDRAFIPDWSAFGEGAAVRLELPNAAECVARYWGQDVAARHFPPEVPAHLFTADPEPTPRKRRRKATKSQQEADAPSKKESDGSDR